MRLDGVLNILDDVVNNNLSFMRSFNMERTPNVAFGIAAGSTNGDYRLAIRAKTKNMFHFPLVSEIVKQLKGETDFAVVGNIVGPRKIKTVAEEMRKRVRPLIAAHSVGHFKITAGTLGTFVKQGKEIFMLSNNHVLANSNLAKIGDLILQPGNYDKGKNPEDVVGKLVKFVEMKEHGNVMDAAIASINKDCVPTDFSLPEIGKIGKTIIPPEDILGKKVQKTGRTTGHTTGEVTAIALRNVGVSYHNGVVYRFDNQIEVSDTNGDFSAGGDSGSFVVDMDGNPVALLFAGSPGHTIVSPIEAILKAFEVELAR